MSSDHTMVGGTLIEASASMESVKLKAGLDIRAGLGDSSEEGLWSGARNDGADFQDQ